MQLYRPQDRLPGGSAAKFLEELSRVGDPRHFEKVSGFAKNIGSFFDDLGPLDASLAGAILENLGKVWFRVFG